MTALDLSNHGRLRSDVEMAREGYLYDEYPFAEQISRFALCMTRIDVAYGKGGRYRYGMKRGASTWSRAGQGDGPALECGGFVNLIWYAMGVFDGDAFNYRGLRSVERDTPFYKEAAGQNPKYKENWIPGKKRTITELNGMSAWAQTPVLLFFRKEFTPVYDELWPKVADNIFFTYKGTDGWHFHGGVWVRTNDDEGLVHSSPASAWDPQDGPKYTSHSSAYWTKYLEPQRRLFVERFGAAATRHVKEKET